MPSALSAGVLFSCGLVLSCRAEALNTAGLDTIVDNYKLPSLAVGIFVGGNNASCPAVRLAAVSHGTNSADRPASALGTTVSSPYLWASVSKTLTHAALTILTDRGDVGMEDDVSTALGFSVRNPNHPNTPVKVKHFFTHATSMVDPVGAELDA
eukprot:Hpha_TRINITY_DN18484_c0_g1::TRINITY_DN18484_c0_g1_i1::g.165439::m.165439